MSPKGGFVKFKLLLGTYFITMFPMTVSDVSALLC